MTRETKLQIVVAFLFGLLLGVAGIVVGGQCIACQNGRRIDALELLLDDANRISVSEGVE